MSHVTNQSTISLKQTRLSSKSHMEDYEETESKWAHHISTIEMKPILNEMLSDIITELVMLRQSTWYQFPVMSDDQFEEEIEKLEIDLQKRWLLLKDSSYILIEFSKNKCFVDIVHVTGYNDDIDVIIINDVKLYKIYD